jgi:hypothetical protein
MMVYYMRDYWVFGFYPVSNILKEHNILEIGSVSVLRWKDGEAPTQLGPLEQISVTAPVVFF